MSKMPTPRATLFVPVLLLSLACGDSNDPMQGQSWALSFDGVDDYVTVPDAAELDLTSQVTLSAWFYFTGGVSGVAGMIQKDGAASYGRYGLWAFSDQVEFCIYIDGGSQACLDSTGGLTLNAWNHVAGVYDGSEMRLYLDGVLDASQALTGAISISDRPLYIGGDPTETYFLPGQLDEVCVWNIARSQADIQMGMSMGTMGSEPGLVGHWGMDDGGGQVVADATSNGLDGTLGLSIGVEAADPVWTMTTWPH